MTLVNHRFTLAARPVGLPRPTDFQYAEEPVRQPGDGEVLIRNRYISLDPAMRGWMNDRRSYVPPIKLGEVIRALALGEVVASNDPKLAPGDHVVGLFGVQEHATVAAKDATKVLPVAPLPVFLSTLGMPGLTAYFGLLDVGKPQPGETVVVSGAAGAVGAVVGQIAKIKGCRAVGIAGGADKCAYLRELGFDAALAQLAMRARVVICGAISQYNATGPIAGPANYLSLLVHRASMTGMVVMDYAARFPEGIMEMAGWMAAGKLKSKEHIVRGLAEFPVALNMLFTGENHGKLMLEV